MALPESLDMLAEAKTMYTKLYCGDWLMWYTEQRWICSTNAGCLHFNTQDTARCQTLWRLYQTWQDTGEDQRSHPRFASEAEITSTLIASLARQGWRCQRESLTTFGRIDIVAMRAARTALIEVKNNIDGTTLKIAMGQLLAYGFAVPEAELWLALPASVPAPFLALFQRYHISIVEVPCQTSPLET